MLQVDGIYRPLGIASGPISPHCTTHNDSKCAKADISRFFEVVG